MRRTSLFCHALSRAGPCCSAGTLLVAESSARRVFYVPGQVTAGCAGGRPTTTTTAPAAAQSARSPGVALQEGPSRSRTTYPSALVVSAAALACLNFFIWAQWAARGGPAAAGRGCAAQGFKCWGPKGGPWVVPAPPWGECRSAFSLRQLHFSPKSSCAT